MKLTGCLLITLCCIQQLLAQPVEKTKWGLTATIQSTKIDIRFYSDRIVRVIKYPDNTVFKKESLSVIKEPESTAINMVWQNNLVILNSKVLVVKLDLDNGKLTFNKPSGTVLFAEKERGASFTPVKDVHTATYKVRQAFLLDKKEAIYGLGQHLNGKMNQRNQQLILAQENMKVCIPFFQSIKGYGVFWDNYSTTVFSDDPGEASFCSEIGDAVDYYFMTGDNADGVIAQMRKLTGQAPLIPLWGYGFLQSRERYKTQQELVDVVTRYRDLNIPLDGIIQDWQYWGKDSLWSGMEFNPETFPDPRKMVEDVHRLNAHLFVVAWPALGPLSKPYQALKANNSILDFTTYPERDGVRVYDAYNPAARDIYWYYLNKYVFSLGVDAWWLDATEPEHKHIKASDFDQQTYLGSYRSVRNAFPLQHVKGVYEHQRATTSLKRVNILTRSAFAGQQRFAANTWSGDVESSWEALSNHIPAALNFSLSGIPYWNSDIGGFYPAAFKEGARDPAFGELYIRWMQFATFTPMMRSHGTGIPREIYQFGKRGEPAFDIQEKYINLRYSLLPYIYATAWNVTSNAGSFMRALHMDFPADEKVWEINNAYLFGQSILVSPVTGKGISSQPVYLPKGKKWYDFWTGQVVEGGQTVNKTTPLTTIPLYIKAGSIIPIGPKVQYATEKKWDNLELRIYSGADAAFTLYEDENDNYNYEKGKYTEIRFKWNNRKKELNISGRQGDFPGMLNSRKINIVLVDELHGIGEALTTKVDKTITYTGRPIMVKLK